MALLRNGIPYDEGRGDPYSSWNAYSSHLGGDFNRFIEAAILETQPGAYA